MTGRSKWAPLAALLLGAVVASAQEKDDGPCGLPPEAKPQRIKGGEGVPPLPLPATPLRRTERKREPAPPILVGKLVWGQQRSKLLADGRKAVWADWNTDPADMQRLLKFTNAKLGTRYRHVACDPRTFSFDPTEIPILYIQGRRAPPALDARTRQRLRDYLLKGGTLWADACHGSADFAQQFRAEMKTVFPDKPLVVLPPDHPVYRSSHAITKVHYSPPSARPDGIPILEGISIGCRTAVFFTPYDLSCAWDSFHVPEDGACVVGEDAVKLGINLAAYSIAYYNLGRFLAQRRTVEGADPQKGDFVFAQVKTNGRWDPDPSAFANLLKATVTATNTKVSFGRKDVTLADPDLASYPFLYLTGHGDFTLSDDELAGLKRFVSNGGFLFADACCGDLGFDRAFRRELARALPGRELALLPKEHPVFSTFHEIRSVTYTAQVRADFKDLTAPHLEGVAVGDETRVVYSRFDLGCGWEGEEHPFALGVESADALKLGTNVVLYALTH